MGALIFIGIVLIIIGFIAQGVDAENGRDTTGGGCITLIGLVVLVLFVIIKCCAE